MSRHPPHHEDVSLSALKNSSEKGLGRYDDVRLPRDVY